VVTSGNKVFWGYTTSGRKFGVACYDRSTGETTKTELDTMHTNNRNIENVGVAVALTSDNKVMVAYATDGDAQKKMVVKISDEPLSIDSFSTASMNLATNNNAYFSQLVESNGNYYLFCRVNDTGSWTYYKSTDGGLTWTRPTNVILAYTAGQYLLKFVPTTDPGLIRVLMCSGPEGSAPEIRMGFFNTADDSLYNADATTKIGNSKTAYTSFDVVQTAEEGKTQRLLDAAITAPNDPRFIFASFTNTAGVNDSEYKLYDGGNVYKICDGGSALSDPTAPLGAAFRGTNELVAIRNADGSDIIEKYLFDCAEVFKTDTLYTHEVVDGSRAARPIVDVGGEFLLWHEGTYTNSKTFSTSGRLMKFTAPIIVLDNTSFTYNGGVQKPAVTVGNLVEGTDYDLEWSDDNSKEVGVYTVTAKFKGEYAGQTDTIADYEILPDPDQAYQIQLADTPYDGKMWGNYQTEGGFCPNTWVTVEAAAPSDSGAWVGVYQAYEENLNGNLGFAWDYVTAASLDDGSALIDLANPSNGGSLNDNNYLNGGCYKAVLFRDSGYTPVRTIYFFIQGNHNLTEHAAVKPTCTEEGNSEYYSCDKCGGFFSDSDGKNEIEENSWIIPPVDGYIQSASLTLYNNIDVNLYAVFTETPSEQSMLVDLNGKTTELEGTIDDTYNDEGVRYKYTFTKLDPRYMGDEFTATLNAVVDGEEVTDTLTYSVKEYCMAMLNGNYYNYEKRMVAELLTLGEETQKYTNYKTDALVTDEMTDDHKALVSQFPTAEEDYKLYFDVLLSGTHSDDYEWVSATVIMNNSFKLRLTFKASDTSNLTISAYGKEYDSQSFHSIGNDKYYIEVERISADAFREDVNAVFLVNEAPIGEKLDYNINTYTIRKSDDPDFGVLAKRLYCFGEAAYGYTHE